MAVLALTLIAIKAGAQTSTSYQLNWNTVAGGAGTCTGAVYGLSGTVGQAETGLSTGGNFSLAAGFWPGPQTEAGPRLRIARSGGFVILSWPASFTGFSLEQCADLRGRNWSAVGDSPVEFNGENQVLLPATASARFYRLVKP